MVTELVYKGFYVVWVGDGYEILESKGGDLIDAGFYVYQEALDYIDSYLT